MAYKCQLCGKGVQYGHNVSHSKRRTRRIFKPNLHRARVLVGRSMKKMLLCTKCLRSTKVKPTTTGESAKSQTQSGEKAVGATASI